MNSLVAWWPSLLIFLAAFAGASAASVFTYWFGRLRSKWARYTSLFFASFFSLISGGFFVAAVFSRSYLYALLFLAGGLILSALQASLEKARKGNARSWGQGFARAFFTCICSAALSMTPVLGFGANFLFAKRMPFGLVMMLYYGYIAGLFFAPLSISFFRWMIPNLHLRPGVDRPLEESDAISPSESLSQ